MNFVNPEGLGWNSSGLPLYSGKVIVSGNNGEQVSVPYLGTFVLKNRPLAAFDTLLVHAHWMLIYLCTSHSQALRRI